MRRGRTRLVWPLALAVLACAPRDRGTPADPDEGTVIVEKVSPGYAAAEAGLRPGDVLLSWQRPPRASGTIRTPFDVALVEIREAPHGAVTLHARRGATPLTLAVPSGSWEVSARPRLQDVDRAAYEAALRDTNAAAALEHLATARTPGLEAAWFWHRAGRAAGEAGDWERANRAHEAAVAQAESAGEPGTLAFLEREAGFALGRQARLPESRRWHERALRRRQAAAPDGLEAASSLLDLAIVAVLLNDLETADRLAKESLAIVERLAPRSFVMGTVLGYTGLIEEKRGRLAAHEAMQLRALAIQEDLDPHGSHTATTLHNLGNLLRRRGDLTQAEGYLRRALAIRERLPPGRPLAYTILALGHVERTRGNVAGARDAYRRALTLIQEHGPDVTAEGVVLVGLGNVALDESDLEGAEAPFRAALTLFRSATPGGSGVISALERLGDLARRRGDHAGATALHREALDLALKSAPQGLDAARAWFQLGETALAQRRWPEAERLLRRSHAIQERAAPGTAAHAEVLHRLGLALWRSGRPAEAEPLLARATDVLDAQQGRLGGPDEAAARFRARYLRIYRDAMELLLERGRTGAAFEMLERSRAIALRQMLAQRDLRRRSDRETPPLGLEGAAASLEPGTLAVSFAVAPTATHVFALDHAGRLRVARVATGEDDLRRQVERFRLLLAAPPPPGEETRAGLRTRASELYRLLLEPVEPEIADAEALLIVPDGALHLLPFAALLGSAQGAPRFVAEWKPLHVAASLTVRDQLGRVPARGRDLIAFGDVPAGPPYSPLPGSRAEVEAVASRFGDHGRAILGRAATERRVKESAPGARILHLAVHGVLDDRLALESGLVLAPDRTAGATAEDGLLQAWEIIEQVRLDAELVTLSACETALGAEVPGEGILGLTSALQYAGAGAVLASLWQVSDDSTAALMERFYHHLAAGRPKSQALQAAQAELIRGPVARRTRPRTGLGRWFEPRGGAALSTIDATHPYHWAAFQLVGAAR